MEITVKMNADDFMDFMEWQHAQQVNDREVREAKRTYERLANKVFNALEEYIDENETIQYKIKDNLAMADLFTSAAEAFA